MIRWTSRIVNGSDVLNSVAVPAGKEQWIDMKDQNAPPPGSRDVSGLCAVEGCGKKRIYRSTKRFEIGGCSMDHLKTVEMGL
jgi:Ino eighty subunit 2